MAENILQLATSLFQLLDQMAAAMAEEKMFKMLIVVLKQAPQGIAGLQCVLVFSHILRVDI